MSALGRSPADGWVTRVDRRRGDGHGSPQPHDGEVTTYRIVLEGELSDRFAATFPGMHLECGDGETSLTGEIIDQAQLQGVLAQVGDLGLSLRSFGPLTPPPQTGVATPEGD
jgi:hypothetical protein